VNPSITQIEDAMSAEIDDVAVNRFEDALAIQEGACNPSGIARTLLRAINACHRENVSTSEDPAVRLIVRQLAHICGVHEINHTPDTYGRLCDECQVKSDAFQSRRAA
jgi:hypothetical protein